MTKLDRLRQQLRGQREAIDAQFALMAHDAVYLAESVRLAEELNAASQEAFELGEYEEMGGGYEHDHTG